MQILDTLRNSKHLSVDEVASLVASRAGEVLAKAESLRPLVDRGGLFAIPKGISYDRILVETALLSIVLAAVSLNDPHARKHQLDTIREVSERLGVDYNDALRLTTHEVDIISALGLDAGPNPA